MSNRHNEASPLLRNRQSIGTFQNPDKPSSTSISKYRSFARLAGCCSAAFAAGWHDGCIGALIPYIQTYYSDITDEKVSFVFIGSFTGFFLASLLNVPLCARLGLSRLLMLGAFFQGLASAIIACKPPFLAIAGCYAIAGFGLALQDAQYNTFVARLDGAPSKLGVVHAIYGVGALMSPVAATLLMQREVAPPLFYFSNLAWCGVTLVVLIVGFGVGGNSTSSSDGDSESESEEEGIASLKTVVSSRAVWAALLFISLYTGAESGEAGWVVSYLLRLRDGGAKSGYASAAFYSGLTSSRILLLPLTAFLNENRAITSYVAIALACQIVVWLSHSFFVDFIAIAACGFAMGPVYPVTVALVTKATPHGYHPGALSLMACVGQCGAGLFPFVVGSLADLYGIQVLQPVLITLFAVMILLWQLVPHPEVALPKPDTEGEDVDQDVIER